MAAFFLDSKVCVAVWLTAEAFDRQTVVVKRRAVFAAKRRCEMMVLAVGLTAEMTQSFQHPSVMPRKGRGVSKLDCLVVSGNRELRNRLDCVTDLSGWSSCDMPTDAEELRSSADGDFQLVIVDIAHPLGSRVNDTVEMAEEFAARPGTLLVICGSEESIEEELWARQLGAWVYLPGVSCGDSLVSLFAEARRVVEQRELCQLA